MDIEEKKLRHFDRVEEILWGIKDQLVESENTKIQIAAKTNTLLESIAKELKMLSNIRD